MTTKELLYRKVNTRARGVHHGHGGDYRHVRNTKNAEEKVASAMHGRKRRGLDYTPLFRFLLSKVGTDWDAVYSEAVTRLDRRDPIFWMVALIDDEKKDYVRVGETSFFSGLYVDDQNLLQVVAPSLSPADLTPSCTCCTYTLNGQRMQAPRREQPRDLENFDRTGGLATSTRQGIEETPNKGSN